MGMATSYGLASKSFLTNTKPKVLQMYNDIRSAFKKMISRLDWMDKKTKDQTVEKCDNMLALIGFPDWLLNRTSFERFYSNVSEVK